MNELKNRIACFLNTLESGVLSEEMMSCMGGDDKKKKEEKPKKRKGSWNGHNCTNNHKSNCKNATNVSECINKMYACPGSTNGGSNCHP